MSEVDEQPEVDEQLGGASSVIGDSAWFPSLYSVGITITPKLQLQFISASAFDSRYVPAT